MSNAMIALLVILIGLMGCSENNPPRDHVWKSQQKASEKAKGAEAQIREAFDRRKKESDD